MGRTRYTRPLVLVLFVLAGLMQTILAYNAFERSGDHTYFVDLANNGPEAVLDDEGSLFTVKAMVAGQTFYLLTTPSRWLGGFDVAHVLWTRTLTLLGFACAYEWMRRLLSRQRVASSGRWAEPSRVQFMVLCVIYPGQLAWTTSLLRDGIACALLFMAMALWMTRWRLLSPLLLGGALSMRPEFVLVVAFIAALTFLAKYGFLRKRRITKMVGLIAVISLAGFTVRQPISEFSLAAFENADIGGSYPAIAHILDIPGYLMVLLQAIIDPIGLAVWRTASPFQLVEVIFFVYVLVACLRRLHYCSDQAAAIIIAGLLTAWIFAYFEIFVSGFSRHRMAIIVMLLAAITLIRRPSLRQTKARAHLDGN